MKKLLLATLLILGCTFTARAQTLDSFGGRTDIACTNATGHFITEKVGTHWYFCDPLGHAFIAMSVTTNAPNGAHTWDCLRVPAGTTSGVTWSSGSATYTFASIPSIATVGNALVTTGFTPSGYNVTNAVITAVGTNTVTVAITTNPGTATVLGTGSFDKDTSGTNVFTPKYGDATFNYGWQLNKRIQSWKFNSIGQDSFVDTFPTRTCSGCVWPGGVQPIQMPIIIEMKPAEDASHNVLGLLTDSIKGEIMGTDSAFYTAFHGGEAYDVFDPKLNTEFSGELARSDPFGADMLRANSQWLLGVFTDDSDFFFGSGAGPDFAGGHTNANLGFITMLSSPVQTFIPSTPQGQVKVLYVDTKNYTKTLATNPVTTCSITNPCSLRDYLWQKYSGSIAALNTAWGTGGAYTSFDSTGTQVTGEALGTGDGVTTVFNGTLAHHPLSPFSVQILVGGVLKAGDCPWFWVGNGGTCITGTSNTGTFGSSIASFINQSTSTINYSTGAVSISFVSPPASGAAITVNYIFNGWMSGGTGLMDENGSHTAWVGTNNFCLEGANPSYASTFACAGSGGNLEGLPNANATFGADIDNWIPEMAAEYFKTMQADLVAAGSHIPYFGLDTVGSWGAPAYSKFLQGEAPYVDGAFVQLLFSANPPVPSSFQSSYQYVTQYLGDKPLMDFVTLIAQADSSESCFSSTTFENFATQNLRGQEWYNTVNYLLTTPGFNGTIPFVGFNWWAWQDFQNANQGLVSLHDNAYDGVESVTASVPCDATYTSSINCGGEAANYTGQFSATGTSITTANEIWLGGTIPPAFPIAPSKVSAIWGEEFWY